VIVVDAGPLIAVATYYLQDRAGTNAELALLALFTTGYLQVAQLEVADFVRAAELVETYRSLNLGTSDTMVVAIAERLGTPKVMTIDQRHFNVVRPRHVDAFELLP
jgi:uncharacterized protein